MAKEGTPTTLATRELDKAKVAWTGHTFPYEEKGGTRHSSAMLGVDEHAVIKTLVFEDEDKRPLVVLMHGDCTVSTKELARLLGKKRIEPCAPEVAERHTGYQVGGTSPFGLKAAAGARRGLDLRPADDLHQRWQARLPRVDDAGRARARARAGARRRRQRQGRRRAQVASARRDLQRAAPRTKEQP